MSVCRTHLRLYVFSFLYYPQLFLGQCLVYMTRLLSKMTETVLHVLWETIILWQVFIYSESFRLCLTERAPSILSSHLVRPRKGTTCQENGETLCQLRSLGSICRRHWWRISSCEKSEKREKRS